MTNTSRPPLAAGRPLHRTGRSERYDKPQRRLLSCKTVKARLRRVQGPARGQGRGERQRADRDVSVGAGQAVEEMVRPPSV